MSRLALLALATVSAAILAFEVLLVRLFSVISWHHFAYMIISIALLGFGASGTALALLQRRLVPRFEAVFAVLVGLFGVTAVLAFAVAARLPFNPLAIVWDPQQLLWLTLNYLLLVLPFFFGGMALGLAFSRFSHAIGQVYAYDLVGAGVGALGIVGVLFLLPPEAVLRLIAALGFVSGALVLLPKKARIVAAGLGGLAIFVAVWLPPAVTALEPNVSQYKRLAGALNVPDAAVVERRWSPLGLVHVVESPTIPFRHAPGLSLANVTEPPLQLGVFTDAEALTAITRFAGDLDEVVYLDFTTAAAPYHVTDEPHVLILGAGGGEQVLLALYHGADEIDAVELSSKVVDIVKETYAEFAGGLYNRDDVHVHVDEARSFVERTDETFDLIQIPLLTSFGTAAAGTQSLHENYTYTVEAMENYLEQLQPGGVLSITTWLKLPPRDAVKLLATAIAVLQDVGILAPGERLAMLRSWNTATLLVKNGAWTEPELVILRAFAEQRSFDLAWLPDLQPHEANRHNILAEPFLYDAARALTGPQAQAFLDTYKFQVAPATDDRPYFYDFFQWRSFPELWGLRRQGAAMLDMGYLILFATLLQAIVLSSLLILAPLVVRRRRFGGRALKLNVSLYFLALGLAFLFIEIAYIQRFVLFLGHPLYAVAVVLAGFLVFAGTGSALSGPLQRMTERRRWPIDALAIAVSGILFVGVTYLFLLPPLFDALIALPDAAKIAVSLVLIAPLATLMGIPFPLGISRVATASADLVPWAWGINGCASVVSAILATILAIHFGFSAVVLIAVALYAITPILLRRTSTASA